MPTTATIQESDWRLILKRVRGEQCVPFLGAGASLGFNGPGLPTGAQLAEALAEECAYPGSDRTDLFRVAQYFAMSEDALELRKSVIRRLLIPNVTPSAVHQAIAVLPFRYVLTTNFDTLMEQAFRNARKMPRKAIYDLHGDRNEVKPASVEEPLVYKLHGCLDQLDKRLIVTEDDVVEFLCCLMLGEPPLPTLIKSFFEDHSFLFIGYGLKDWNIRVILRAIRGGGKTGRPPDIASFAIQRRPRDANLATEWEKTVLYWEKRESLRCFDMDALDFATELKGRYETGGKDA